MLYRLIFTWLIFGIFLLCISAKKSNPEEKPDWAKKDIRDFSDADMERLLDQWEVSPLYLFFINIKTRYLLYNRCLFGLMTKLLVVFRYH